MTNRQLAYVIGLLALTDDPRQLAALGRFLADAFPDDLATPVLLRNVRRRVREYGAPDAPERSGGRQGSPVPYPS